jgi:hypothetical protein
VVSFSLAFLPISYTLSSSPNCTTCSSHVILHNLIILIILGEENKSRNSSLCRFLKPHVISYLFGPNNLRSILFLNTLTLRPFLNVRDNFSNPYCIVFISNSIRSIQLQKKTAEHTSTFHCKSFIQYPEYNGTDSFVDDTSALTSGPDIALQILQTKLDEIQNLLKKWRINANESKSVHVTITRNLTASTHKQRKPSSAR